MEAAITATEDQLLDAMGAGKFEVVSLEMLHLDETYQRDLSRDLVEKIRREWDPTAAGAIVVSRRVNGDLHIVDGQHRTAAAKEMGKTELLARVIEGLDSRAEARLRLMGNTRRPDTAMERFRAQVAAGDQESISIQQIVTQFGTKINANPDQHAGINTVAAVEDLYRMDDKGDMLVAVLEVVREAFGQVAGRAASSAMLKSVGWFLNKHRSEIDRARFIERLAAEGYESVDRKARNHKAASGGSLWTNYYRAMVEIYNVRLSDAQRLEIRTGGWSAGKTRRTFTGSTMVGG